MKFYRVHFTTNGGCSAGYLFFSRKGEAGRWVTKFNRENAFDPKDPQPTETAEMDTIEVKPTKAGILDALNRYGVHPDNG